MTEKKRIRPDVVVTYPARPLRNFIIQEKDGHGCLQHPMARISMTPTWDKMASSYGVLPGLDRDTVAQFLTANLNAPNARLVTGAARHLDLHVALDEPTADGRVAFTAYMDRSMKDTLVQGNAHPTVLNDLLWLLVGL